MSDDEFNPTGSRFGWPKPTRKEEFKARFDEKPEATTRVVFQGQTRDIPIIRVPIALPKYRMVNGRTASRQTEHLARHPSLRADMFSGDPELLDAQEAQHMLLVDLSKASDLQKYFENTAIKQVDPILLDENGFVINGNRRLATWRELVSLPGDKYAHFRHIDVAVLPHSTEAELDRLEASLQIEKDIKADYTWDAQANMMIAKQKRDQFSDKDLADLYKMREGEIEQLKDMRAYAEEYLKSRGKANLWSLVSGDQLAFQKISQSRPKVAGLGNQEVFKQAAFALIDNPAQAGGRLYEAIPAMMENLDQVKTKLIAEIEVEDIPADSSLDALFGGGAPSSTSGSEMALATAMQKPENGQKIREIIVEVIESQKQLKKEAKSANYLIDCCAKAHALLAAASKDGLRPEAKLKGVAAQLDQIETQCATIRKYLAEHAQA